MTSDEVKEILDRVSRWPPQRREEAAAMLRLMEEQDTSPYQLTDEQLSEVRRRRSKENPRTLTLAEFDERLRRFDI